ncbi:hypothetical protein ZWY2020_001170 [Hordeum vulgare]|nr:hypothetical protein ZWY2020_001170 [Hordeum vulgare]
MAAFSLTSCFPCLTARKKEAPRSAPANPHTSSVAGAVPRTFSFEELAAATRNFSDGCRIIGQGGGLYKGYIKSINQVTIQFFFFFYTPSVSKYNMLLIQVAHRSNIKEFLAHTLTMCGLRHPNVVDLIGFCADGHHRILVHEYMPGSLEDHLHDLCPGKAPLDWITRMNIAAGVARGLEYMHDKGVLYRRLRKAKPQPGFKYEIRTMAEPRVQSQSASALTAEYFLKRRLSPGLCINRCMQPYIKAKQVSTEYN